MTETIIRMDKRNEIHPSLPEVRMTLFLGPQNDGQFEV